MNTVPAASGSRDPTVTFYRAIPQSFEPMRADRSALGVIPTAAFQYCEALTSASAFGWYVFPPMTFHLQWDGTDVIWSHDDADAWFPLTSEHFPNFPEHFDRSAPEDIRGYAPPFLTRSFFPGVVQVWSGLFVKTAPGWSLLVRPPVNLERLFRKCQSGNPTCLGGILEVRRIDAERLDFLGAIRAVRPFVVIRLPQRAGVRKLRELSLDFLAVMDLQAGKDLLDVIARGIELESQRARDLLVALPIGEQQGDLALLR